MWAATTRSPLAANAAIAAALENSRLEVFDRSGHYPFVEEPTRFAAVVRAFLLGRPPNYESRNWSIR